MLQRLNIKSTDKQVIVDSEWYLARGAEKLGLKESIEDGEGYYAELVVL